MPARAITDFGVVRDDDQRDAVGVEAFDRCENLGAGGMIQISGRLVGERMFGRITMARAMATRCRCPPDNSFGR